jgi:hypothetical protein
MFLHTLNPCPKFLEKQFIRRVEAPAAEKFLDCAIIFGECSRLSD